MFRVEPITLENQWIRLEPSRPDHSHDLAEVATPGTFAYFVTDQPKSFNEAGLRDFIESLLIAPATVCFTVIDPATQKAIGMTTYMDIRPDHRGLEIGRTWYAERARGTKINPAAKLLLMEHAFEILGAVRVQLKTDMRNLHSQAAIKKLGAVYEGTLRQHGIMPDGYIRDTVMFSVIPPEWPAVKAGLLNRLNANP